MAEQPYKYWAFISYSHQDRAWANWLHKSLETYRVPHRLVGREHWSGPLPRRLMPVFRDRDELPSSAELGSVLNEALQQSRYLIVICSPQSARSRWVNEEVKYFKSLGRAQRVLPLIIGGEPNATDAPNSGQVECLPPAIRFEVDSNGELSKRKAEPIAADARGGKDGRATAKLKLIAGLIGVGLDELRQRERQRQFQRRIFAASAGIALTLLAGWGWRWQQNEKQHALQAQELKVRIAQLYENGRQELLAHNEARAAVYLNEAYKLGVDTPALRYMLARAMRVVDAQALRVHVGSDVFGVAMSPDGKRFLAVDQSFRVSVWSAENGEKLGAYDLGPTAQYAAVLFSPKGGLILAATDHSDAPLHRLQILSADAKQVLAQIVQGQVDTSSVPIPVDKNDQNLVYLKEDLSIEAYSLRTRQKQIISGKYSAVRYCNDQQSIIAGTNEGTLLLFDGATGKLRKKFSGLRGTIVALDSSDGCKAVVAGTSEGAVRVWNVYGSEALMTAGLTRAIADIAVNADLTRLTIYTHGGVSIWNGQDGALVFARKFNTPEQTLAVISPGGDRLAIMNGSRLTMLDPLSGADLYTLDGHKGAPRNFNFGVAAQKFISSGPDGSVVIWTLPKESLAGFLKRGDIDRKMSSAYEGAAIQATLNRHGDKLFVGNKDGTGELWRVDSLHKDAEISGYKGPIDSASFSASDRLLATAGWDQALNIWDVGTGKLLRRLGSLKARSAFLSFDSSSKLLSSALKRDGAEIWDVDTGEKIARFGTDFVRAQAFSPTTQTYAYGLRGVTTLWDAKNRRSVWKSSLPHDETSGDEISVISFSPDGKRVFVALTQQEAFILDTSDGHIVQKISERSAAGIYVAEFSHDNNRVVFGTSGKSVFVWSLVSNHVSQLLGHEGGVRAVSFSPDDALLASAGADGVIRIWDAYRSELIDSFVAHDGSVNWGAVQFNMRGDALLTSGADSDAQLWDMHKERRDPAEIAALLRCRVSWRVVGATLISAAPEIQGCSRLKAS